MTFGVYKLKEAGDHAPSFKESVDAGELPLVDSEAARSALGTVELVVDCER
jgi:hypothetical protein